MTENEEKLDITPQAAHRRQRQLHALKNSFCSPVKTTKAGLWELPTKLIGAGSYASIAEVCAKGATDCNYAMKLIGTVRHPDDWIRTGKTKVDPKPFLNEVALQEEAAKIGVAPPVIDSWLCDDPPMGVLVMPRLKKTLQEVLQESDNEEEREAYLDKALSILQELNKNDIQHNDCHLENFMIDFNGDLKIIDFGFAQKIEPCSFEGWKIPQTLVGDIAPFVKKQTAQRDKNVQTEIAAIQKIPGLSANERKRKIKIVKEKQHKIYNEIMREHITDICTLYKEYLYEEDESLFNGSLRDWDLPKISKKVPQFDSLFSDSSQDDSSFIESPQKTSVQ